MTPDDSEVEVLSFIKWSQDNNMKFNLQKTWELVLRGKTTKALSEPLERKNNLRLLGVTLEEDPTNWDTHIEYLLTEASSRLYSKNM